MSTTVIIAWIHFRDIANCLIDLILRQYEKRMAASDVQRCLDWLLEQKADLEVSSFGQSRGSVNDARLRHVNNKVKVAQYRKTIDDVAAKHTLTMEENRALQAAYNVVQLLADKKSGCFEVVSGVAGLEDHIQTLSTEFDNKAVHLVNMAANNKSQKKTPGLDNESMAKTTQNCITAVRQTWKWLDEVMQCAHVHLSNAAAYHEFFHDVEEVDYWMNNTMSTMHLSFNRPDLSGDSSDLTSINSEMKDTMMAYLRWQSKVDSVLRRAGDIVPVQKRVAPVSDPCPVMALCSYKTEEIEVTEGESLTLLDNSDRNTWKVRNTRNQIGMVPAVIMLINGPSGEAVDAAVRLRLQLLGLWTTSIKRLGFQMIAFMQVVFKDWSEDEIKAIQHMPEGTRRELSRILVTVESTLKKNWQGYEGFEELQEKISRLNTILDEANGNGNGSSSSVVKSTTGEVVVQVKMLEELLNSYQSFWTYWETYKVGVELFKQPKYLLVCDKWDQLKYTTSAHFVRFWDTNLLFPNKGGKVYKAEAALTLQETPRKMTLKGDEATIIVDSKSLEAKGLMGEGDVKGDKNEDEEGSNSEETKTWKMTSQSGMGEECVEDMITSETSEKTHSAMGDLLPKSGGDGAAQADDEYGTSSTDIIQNRRRQEMTTDEVVQSTTTVKHTFIIKSVTDPRTQEEMSLKDAIMAGIIDNAAGRYINSVTGENISLQEAMANGDITVEFKSQRKIQEERSSYGIITIKTMKETRPFTMTSVIDPKSDEEIPIDEAYKRGILNKADDTYRTETGEIMQTLDAIKSGLIKAEFHGKEEDNAYEETKTYAVNGVIDQRRKEKVSFSQAINQGLLIGDEGVYFNNQTLEKVPITDAIMRGFIKARIVTDTSRLDIDPNNTIVIKRIANTKKKILSAVRVAKAFSKAGHASDHSK